MWFLSRHQLILSRVCSRVQAEWASPDQQATHSKAMLPESFWDAHGPTPHCVIRSPNEPIDFDVPAAL